MIVTKIDERVSLEVRAAETVPVETGLDVLATFLDVVHTLGDGVLEVTLGGFVPASHACQTTVRPVDVLLKELYDIIKQALNKIRWYIFGGISVRAGGGDHPSAEYASRAW